MIGNAIFLKVFWQLKVTEPVMCFRVNQVYMFLSQSNIFISSPRWIFIFSQVGFVVSTVGFLISPMKTLLLSLTPEKFWQFCIFPVESSSPYRGTETGCVILSLEQNRFVSSTKSTISKALVELLRSFTKIRKGPSIEIWGTLHLTILISVLKWSCKINCFLSGCLLNWETR